nr:HNH endonuclease [Roseomonas marmotae]
MNGYQRGHCFYCRAETPLAEADVDHFFPWVLKERGAMPDADSVWNLVLACRRCNRGEGGKFAAVPVPALVQRLHQRNNWLVDSHHPLRETILLQTGLDAEARAGFLRGRLQMALEALIHHWQPREQYGDA